METLFVRLKPYDPRRGQVLRRFVYRGIKIAAERGWYCVEKPVAEYLKTVNEVPGDPLSPLAFDVYSQEEAKALDSRQELEAKQCRSASDSVELSPARSDTGVVTKADVRPKVSTREEAKAKDKKA
jgi:hypothetical protein